MSITNTQSQPLQYIPRRVLGRGGNSVVFEIFDTWRNGKFAAKQITFANKSNKDYVQRRVYNEFWCMKAIHSHPHILCCFDLIEKNNFCVLIVELMEMDLSSYIQAQKPNSGISVSDFHFISCQILSGIEFLHRNQLVHRDLKPGNILIQSKTKRVKISDFGEACYVKNIKGKRRTKFGTAIYWSPELLLFGIYKQSLDIWAFGCVLVEMILGVPLFYHKGMFLWTNWGRMMNMMSVIGVVPYELLLKYQKYDDNCLTNVYHLLPKFNPINLRKLICDKRGRRWTSAVNIIETILQYDETKRPTAVSLFNENVCFRNTVSL